MSKKTRTCVVGAGGMGRNHCRILSEISSLVGICDKNKTRACEVAKEFGSFGYGSVQEMLADCHPEAAVVAVNTQFHKEVALELLSYGIPVLVEKPLALSATEARKIISSAKKRNIFLMVGMVERYNPTIVKLKHDISKGVFGNIYQVVAMRVGISAPNMNPRSVDVDLSVHDIDIINYLFNERPKKATKTGNGYLKGSKFDTCSLTLSYQNKTATIISNWLSPIKIRRLYIFGEKMSAEVNMLGQVINYFSKIPLSAITKGNAYASFQELGGYSKKIAFKKSEPLVAELKAFLKYSKKGYRGDLCENGLHAQEMLEGAKLQ